MWDHQGVKRKSPAQGLILLLLLSLLLPLPLVLQLLLFPVLPSGRAANQSPDCPAPGMLFKWG